MENHIENIRDKLRGALTAEETLFMHNLKTDLINLYNYFDNIEVEAIKTHKIYIRLPERLKESILQFKGWYN